MLLAYSTKCSFEGYDLFVVRDGISANSPVLLELSGTAQNVACLSTVSQIFVGFFPDYSINDKGFNVSWTAELPVRCFFIITSIILTNFNLQEIN